MLSMFFISATEICGEFLLPNASFFSVALLFGYLLLSPSAISARSISATVLDSAFATAPLSSCSGSISGHLYVRPDRVVMRGYWNSCQRWGSHHCHQMWRMGPGGSRMCSVNMRRRARVQSLSVQLVQKSFLPQ